MRCSECRFFDASYCIENKCRLNPPVYIGLESPNYQSSMLHTFKFPTVKPDDWCSHFEKRVQETE